MIKFLAQSGCEILAFLVGTFFAKRFTWPYKLIYLQVALVTLVEIAGYYIKKEASTNAWIFNLYLPLDCGILLLAAYGFLKERFKPAGFFIAYSIYSIIWTVGIANSSKSFAFASMIADATILVVAYLMVLYYSAMSYHGNIMKLPIFWICLGIILYYGCAIPFFSMYQFLTSLSKDDKHKMYFILQVLNNIRYIFTTLSFILLRRQVNQVNNAG